MKDMNLSKEDKNEVVVSVIIPHFNDVIRLEKCLRALMSQSIEKKIYEIIVVDNNSKEDLSFLKASYPDVIFLLEDKVGSYAARNKGLLQAKGSIIGFTDSDCIPDKDWLKNGKIALESIDGCGVVGGKISLFFSNPEKKSLVEKYEKYTAFNQEELVKHNCNTTANWFSYKHVLEEAGLFDASLKSNGDTLMAKKINSLGYKIIYAPTVIVNHPARRNFSEITQKNRRILGGRVDRHIQSGEKNLIKLLLIYNLNFIYGKAKFSIGSFFKRRPLADCFAHLVVSTVLCLAVMDESLKLAKGSESLRK
jgi:glycosyltransferase involved in cell wall biosynthesis